MANIPDGSSDASARRRKLEKRPQWERDLLAEIGRRVRSARQERELTIAALAMQVSLDPTYLGELERGRANVSVTTLALLAKVFGIGLSQLLP